MMKNSKKTIGFSLGTRTAWMILLLLIIIGSTSLQAQLPTLNWAGQFKESNNYVEASWSSISRDGAGNVYTVGNYLGGTIDLNPGTNPGDTFILYSPPHPVGWTVYTCYISKLNTSGHFSWGQRIWSNHSDVSMISVSADADGNVYTTGYFRDTAHFGGYTLYAHPNPLTIYALSDAFVCKQDAQGNFIWVKQIGSKNADGGVSLSVSPSGNIVVLGSYSDTMEVMTASGMVTLSTPEQRAGFFVATLRSTGEILWIKQLGNDSLDIGFQLGGSGCKMSLDAEGNIYIGGVLNGTVDFDSGAGSYVLSGSGEMAVCKLTPQGDLIWAKKVEKLPSYWGSSVEPHSIYADYQGNVYITGRYKGKIDFDSGPDSFILNAEPMNGFQYDIYDIFISKWNSSGDFSWVRALTRTGADSNFIRDARFINHATSIFADESGNVYTTGSIQGYMDMNSDTAVGDTLIFLSNTRQFMGYIHKLDADGNFQWAIPIKEQTGHYRSTANQIIKDDSGHLYVTGNFEGTVNFDPQGSYTLSGGGTYVLKLNDTAVQGVGITATETQRSRVQLYPNPAGNELWLQSSKPLQLKMVWVYNMLGQELRMEKVSNKALYRMGVQSLPPGLYMLKVLLSDGSVAERKFEVMR